jgi:ABC-type transport system involved in multi-copper enzyme maturation permease subunit
MRLLRFTGFSLLEYLRSGRVAIELIAVLSVYAIFLRRPMSAEYFFSVCGVLTPVITLYTMAAFIGLGDRPQGYVLLSRGVGRAIYLLGLFLGAVVIVAGAYGLTCLIVAVLNRPSDLDLGGWLLGTLPLLLNIGLLAALMLMLSPLVFPTSWRLFVLGMIALAFSSNFIGGQLLEVLPDAVRSVLRAMQALLGGPLVPAFYGFQLAVTRDYSTPTALANLLAQASLLVSLLGLSIYAFARRDLILSSQ